MKNTLQYTWYGAVAVVAILHSQQPTHVPQSLNKHVLQHFEYALHETITAAIEYANSETMSTTRKTASPMLTLTYDVL